MTRAKHHGTIKIEQVRSEICTTQRQRATLHSLKLGKLHRVVELPDNEAVRGMVNALPHLVKIIEEKK